MHPARAGRDVARRELGRVAVAHLAVEVPLREADGGAAPQVDGGKQLHHAGAMAARLTKLASRASPVAPDFSGWNCAPQSGPRVASAATGPP